LILTVIVAGCAATVTPVSNENILTLSKRAKAFEDSLPKAEKLGLDQVTAFEEHAHFLFVMGTVNNSPRRMIVLKPSAAVVADGCMVRQFKIEGGVVKPIGEPKKCTKLQVKEGKLTFDLELPADETGMISIKQDDGKVLVTRRPLPRRESCPTVQRA